MGLPLTLSGWLLTILVSFMLVSFDGMVETNN